MEKESNTSRQQDLFTVNYKDILCYTDTGTSVKYRHTS